MIGVHLAVIAPAVLVDDLAPGEETVWTINDRRNIRFEAIFVGGGSRMDLGNDRGSRTPLRCAMNVSWLMNPLERINLRSIMSSEMKPHRMRFLLSTL